MDPHCFDVDPDPAKNIDADPDPDPDSGGGGGCQPKICIPPGKNLGTPLVPVVLQGEHVNSSLVTRAAQPFVCQTAQNMQTNN